MAIRCPECQSDNPEKATFCADCGSKLVTPKHIEIIETIELPKEEITTGSTFEGRNQIIEEFGRWVAEKHRRMDMRIGKKSKDIKKIFLKRENNESKIINDFLYGLLISIHFLRSWSRKIKYPSVWLFT